MKFELRHAFSCPPARLWEITDSEEFEQELAAATSSTRGLEELKIDGDVRYTRRRIAMRRELPAAMRKVLGTDEIGYVQETWRPLVGDRLRWKITAKVIGDRFSGEGATVVRATPTGCERVINGDLQVKVPLLGGAMEKRLVDDVSASYERAAELIRKFVARAAE